MNNFTNQEIAQLLKEIAAVYIVKNEDRFKIMAYENAAVSIERATDDQKFDQLAGVGPSIASHLDELFTTGKVKHFDEIKKDLPAAMFELLVIPGIGPKTAFKLSKELKLEKGDGIADLERMGKKGKIRKIDGFGEKTERDILEGIKAYKNGQTKENRMLIGEIQAALRQAQGKQPGLPELVELKDIKGDLHLHSDFPIETSHDDGLNSMEDIIRMGEKLGYEYLGFSEHNPSVSKHHKNEIIELIKKKKEAIDQVNYSSEKGTNKLPIKVFNGLEIDIQPNGNLALPEEAFKYLDYAIVSIHSSFNLSRQQMTKRVLKALSHPKAKIFGHPTGRMLGKREGYELDWDLIFDFCLTNHKWLEINCWPERLDLPEGLVYQAVKKGVKLIIGSDSHQVDQLTMMKYGVNVARRGWAEKSDIINTLNRKEVNEL